MPTQDPTVPSVLLSSQPTTPTTHGVEARTTIADGNAILGIELGSSRIKAVLIGADHEPLATANHTWENQLLDRLWTYPLEDAWLGVQDCFRSLADEVTAQYGVELTTLRAIGISGMMHGYLAFDADGQLLAPFRTWRNTSTGPAAEQLSREFGFNIPHRWTIAHLQQAILNREDHVARIGFLTTLAGYIHWQLSGQQVLGIGDASGMFPIDVETGDYDAAMVDSFDRIAAAAGIPIDLASVLPQVKKAGENAGRLSAAGAALLDPTGRLLPGATMCPPEGDAGTGMVATNSIAPRTGNVSAGTSIFAMVVLDHELSHQHRELDLVTTPAGDPVAMVHCNNGASELSAWVSLFVEFTRLIGANTATTTVFEKLITAALDGTADCGGLLAYNYLAGEPITDLDEGRPLFLRAPDSHFNLATFMRTHVFAALATLRIGMDILQKDEKVVLDEIFAHGGLFKTRGVAQRLLAAAIDTPVTVGEIAAEGGAWGIAVLAAYTASTGGQTLSTYLTDHVFAAANTAKVRPEAGDVAGFNAFIERYTAALPVERSAIQHS